MFHSPEKRERKSRHPETRNGKPGVYLGLLHHFEDLDELHERRQRDSLFRLCWTCFACLCELRGGLEVLEVFQVL